MTDRQDGKAKPPHRDPPRRTDLRKRDWIAGQLRRVYDEALQEEIPADMLALLGKLDETDEDKA